MSGKIAHTTTFAVLAFFLRCLTGRRSLRITLLLLIVILFYLIFRSISFLRRPQPVLSNIFALSPLPLSPNPIASLPTTANFASSDYLEAWISTGRFPSGHPPFKDVQLDVIYTWVNGSDDRLRKQRTPFDEAASNLKYLPPQHARVQGPGGRNFVPHPIFTRKGRRNEKRYRDNDELRYSIRSVIRNMPFTRQITIVSTDFPYDPLVASHYDPLVASDGLPAGEFDSNTIFRAGQVPQWILPSVYDTPSSATTPLRFVHHSQIFDPAHLPSFNSLAIESHLMDVPNVLPQFLYLNDDTFISSPTTPSDFYTPLYGFVFHTEARLAVKPNRDISSGYSRGEWGSLEWSNELLSARFGRRSRAYITHIHHMMSSEILREIQLEWPAELNDTASHHFRGNGWDIHLAFLFTHYVVERHREALLHSYLALRLDKDGDGVWSWDERQEVLNVVQKWQGDTNGSTLFHAPSRKTMSQWIGNLERGGINASSATNYTWSSADGYAFSLKRYNASGEPTEDERYYHPENDRVESRVCRINMTQCFPSGFEDPAISGVKVDWKKVAFENVACGDCLAMILVAESGESGFEAFLPPKDAMNRMEEDTQNDWSTIGLIPERGLQNRSGTVWTPTKPSFDPSILTSPQTLPFLNPFTDSSLITIRQRTIARIHRYSYVFGRSRYSFISLKTPWAARMDLQKILSYQAASEAGSTKLGPETRPMSFFCINDDIDTFSQSSLTELQLYVREFLETWFPGRSPYERWSWEPKPGYKPSFNVTLIRAGREGKRKMIDKWRGLMRLKSKKGARVKAEG